MFKYLNLNPLSIEEEDCVTRAIALASGYSYADIQDKLYYMARLFDCEELCVCCYKHLLDDIFDYPRVKAKGRTVGELCEVLAIEEYLVLLERNRCVFALSRNQFLAFSYRNVHLLSTVLFYINVVNSFTGLDCL